jgi:AraC-like DNA-binding protein
MSSRLLKPWPVLADVIESIDLYDTAALGEGPAYSVLPSPQFVMGFQLEGRLKTIRPGNEKTLTPSGVTGIQGQSRLYQGVGKTRSILVRFKPWGPSCFLPGPMGELMNESVDLRQLWDPQEVSDLEDKLYQSEPVSAVVHLQTFLIKHRRFQTIDSLALNAAKRFMLKAGNVLIGRVAGELATTERSLERRFQQWIGTSPKRFAALLRFQKSIQLLQDGKEGAEVAYECGYFDQAHFIQEFKNFTGVSPQKYKTGLL